jgi:hypothetical protein
VEICEDSRYVRVRVYPVPIRTPIRILLNYAGAARPLLWFSAGADGSVYLGLSRPAGSVGYGGDERNAAGEVRLEYSNVEWIDDPTFCKRIHVSFHSSGVINAGGKRARRASWRNLTTSHQLCLFVLEHPSHFPPARGTRKQDFVLNYPVDEARPIHGKLFVNQVGTFVGLKHVVHQTGLIFNIRGLETSSMDVELVLGHGDLTGPWPPHTIVGCRAGGPPARGSTG